MVIKKALRRSKSWMFSVFFPFFLNFFGFLSKKLSIHSDLIRFSIFRFFSIFSDSFSILFDFIHFFPIFFIDFPMFFRFSDFLVGFSDFLAFFHFFGFF